MPRATACIATQLGIYIDSSYNGPTLWQQKLLPCANFCGNNMFCNGKFLHGNQLIASINMDDIKLHHNERES